MKTEETIKLWAEFGELSAQREILIAQLQGIVNQKRDIYRKIMKLQDKEKEKQDEKQE